MLKRIRLFLILMLLPVIAQANTTQVSGVMTAFQQTTNGWYTSIYVDAMGLFAALFGIEIVWLVTKWLISGKDVHEIFTSFIKKLISIGFFYSLLFFSSQWIPELIDGFKNVAIDAGGQPITTVGAIIDTGIHGFVTCIEGGPLAAAHDASSAWSDVWSGNASGAISSALNGASAIASGFSAIAILIDAVVGLVLILSFTYAALELVAVQLEGMIVLSVGVLMLGFGGMSATTQFAESYLKYAFSVGVRLMIITLWLSFVEWKVSALIKQTLISGNASLESYGIVLILALLVAWLTKKLPNFANSLLSGQSTLSGGEMYKAVKDATIAAGAAVATAGMGGAAMLGAKTASSMGAASGTAGSGGVNALSAANNVGNATSSAASKVIPDTKSAMDAANPRSGVLPKMDSTASPPSSPSAQPSGVNTGQKTASQPSGEQRTETPKPQAESSQNSGSEDKAQDVEAAVAGLEGAGLESGLASKAAPKAASSGVTPSKGAAQVLGGKGNGVIPNGNNATPSGNKAPTTEAPSENSSAPDSVDHRPSAPNEAPQSGSSGGSTVPAPDPVQALHGKMDQLLDQTKPKDPSFMDKVKQNAKKIEKTHGVISPGESSGASVSAPSLGVKHLSD